MTSITIPESTTTIEWGAFGACESLSKVYYSGDIKHWCKLLWNDDLGSNIGPHDLYIQGNKITELVLPNDITIINAYAFYNCICLMSIYIPDSVTCIKKCAFSGCKGLTSINLPNSIISIGIETFAHCEGLVSITIPNNVTCIGDAAFMYCSNLTSIFIGEGVTHIGKDYFYGCGNLTSIKISNSIEDIEEGSFIVHNKSLSLTLPSRFFSPIEYPKDYRGTMYSSKVESILRGSMPSKLILTGEEKRLDFTLLQLPETIYCTSEIEELILPSHFYQSEDCNIYINNFIEKVNVIGSDKWTDVNLFFRAPSPASECPQQSAIELTLNPRSSFFLIRDRRWKCPIMVDINSVTYVYPLEMNCYQKNYLGSRLLLCGPSTDESHMEYLKKTESYPFIDVWENYETVCSLLKKGGWAKCAI